MKVKELIKYLETLDQNKEIIIIAVDPTDYYYPTNFTPDNITLETLYEDHIVEEAGFPEVLPDPETGEMKYPECYVIKVEA